MLLLAAFDATHVLVADELGWRVEELQTGRVTARGEAGDIPARGGRWEIDGQGVAWRPDGGAASPRWSGNAERVAVGADALWVQAKDTIVRIGAETKTRHEADVRALGADPGGAVWASEGRLERVDGEGKTLCALPLSGARPVAIAASSAWIALGDHDGLLLVDVVKCAAVAASPMRVDALAFVGDRLLAMRDGSLRPIALPSLDAPVDRGDPGLLPLDAPDRPRLVDATGIHDPHTGGFIPIPADHLVTARAVVGRESGRLQAWDATGRVFADLADPLVSLHLAATAGDALVASDGTRIVYSGGGVATPGFAFSELRAVDTTTALVREGTRWWRVRASGAPERTASPWDAVRAGPVAWVDAAVGSLDFAAAALPDGFRVVRRSDGHWIGPALAGQPGKLVAVDPGGRLAVTLMGEELVGFDLTTGRPRWRSKAAAGAWAGVERVDRAAVVTATGAELRLVDPVDGAVAWRIVDGERVETPSGTWRPGAPPLPWPGRPEAGSAPADGGVASDPTAIVRAFGWASGWNPVDRSPRDWSGWCGREAEAAGLLVRFPAIAARVATVLGDCERPLPVWQAEKVEEHAAPAAIDEPCDEPLPMRDRADLSLPLQTGRPTLVVAGPVDDIPPGIDVLLLADAPEEYQSDASGTRVSLRRARPLPACLGTLGDADGAVLVDGSGHARMRGDVQQVTRAGAALVNGEGVEAVPPIQRWRASEAVQGLAAGGGAMIAWTAHHVGRLAPGAWVVAVEATMVTVVDSMVLVQEKQVTRALDVDSGEFLWRLPGTVTGRDGKRVLIEDRGVTRAIDASGEAVWTHAGLGSPAGGGWATSVAGWTCSRDADRRPGTCGRTEVDEPGDLRFGDGVSLYRGRKQLLTVPGATFAEPLGAGRLYIGGPAILGRVVDADGRTLAVLPTLGTVVVEGGRVWGVRKDGSVEVYRP